MHCLKALAISLPLALGLPALAQTVSDVHFQAGNYGAMVSGTVIGREYIDYRLGAKKGQKLFAELTVSGTNGSGTVYFNILPPGSDDVAIYNSSVEGNSATVTLTASGTWTIRVYQMGNDKDADKTSGFNLDLSIQ